MANAILGKNPNPGIDLNRIVNVSVTSVASAVAVPNVNNIAFFTTDTSMVTTEAKSYVSYASVLADYGTNSDTANFANILFQANLNITNAGGVLWVIPYIDAISATASSFTTSSLTANLTNFQAVSDGALTINIDGTVFDVVGLDFTGVTTIQGIADILQSYLLNVTVTVSGTSIIFTSKKFGTTSLITLSDQGTGTDITEATYLNIAGGTGGTAGVNSTGETLPQAVARTMVSIPYCGIATNLDMGDVALTAAGSYINGLAGKWLQNVISSIADVNLLALPNATAGRKQNRFFIYTTVAERVQAKAGAMTLIVGVDYQGSNTTKTSQGKKINGLAPDPLLYDGLYPILNTAGCDYYTTIGGTAFAVSTGGNGFADNFINEISLAFYCQYAIFNNLITTNTKLPQTEAGMISVKTAARTVLAQFVTNGYIAPGTWNSSQTFGDYDQFVTDIKTLGYYMYSLPIAQQSQSDRDARIAPVIQVAAKIGGALQTFTLTATTEN